MPYYRLQYDEILDHLVQLNSCFDNDKNTQKIYMVERNRSQNMLT
jgi:hypothetical protein